MSIMADRGNPKVTLPAVNLDTVAFAGDWHASAQDATAIMKQAAIAGAKIIFQLGDFGLWPGRSGTAYLKEVNRAAELYDLHVLWLDGNHEDFNQIKAVPLNPDTGLQDFAPRVSRLPRGSRFEIAGVSFAVIGGATSLDRPYRTLAKESSEAGALYWPEEEVTPDQIEDLLQDAYKLGPVDVLLTHDAPFGVNVPGINHGVYTPSWSRVELERAWAHRQLLLPVVQALKPSLLLHGHFHIKYQGYADAFNNKTRVVGLADGSQRVSDALHMIDLVELRSELKK